MVGMWTTSQIEWSELSKGSFRVGVMDPTRVSEQREVRVAKYANDLYALYWYENRQLNVSGYHGIIVILQTSSSPNGSLGKKRIEYKTSPWSFQSSNKKIGPSWSLNASRQVLVWRMWRRGWKSSLVSSSDWNPRGFQRATRDWETLILCLSSPRKKDTKLMRFYYQVFSSLDLRIQSQSQRW